MYAIVYILVALIIKKRFSIMKKHHSNLKVLLFNHYTYCASALNNIFIRKKTIALKRPFVYASSLQPIECSSNSCNSNCMCVRLAICETFKVFPRKSTGVKNETNTRTMAKPIYSP